MRTKPFSARHAPRAPAAGARGGPLEQQRPRHGPEACGDGRQQRERGGRARGAVVGARGPRRGCRRGGSEIEDLSHFQHLHRSLPSSGRNLLVPSISASWPPGFNAPPGLLRRRARVGWAEMSVRGALSILGVLAVLSAGLVGLVSRAPANVRRAEVAAGAREPDRGARFSAEQVRRAAAYNRPSYLAVALLALLRGGLLVALALGPWGRLVDALQGVKGGWAVRAVLAAWILVALAGVVTLPVTFVHGFVIEHAWGLSTQGVGGWATDRLRSLLVGGCTTAVAAVAFFGVVRWQPRTWWLWGWGAFTLLTALLVFIWPLVVAPLFNRFTPLDDPELREAVTDLARGAGVEVSAVLVADASRRTRTENAYVAGLGETRRLVLYDTLLEGQGRRETLWVVGHELGHEAERHVLKGVVLSAAGLLVGFGALAWLAARPGVWAW